MTANWVSGWCSGPNHHKCHHVYEVRERTYVCACTCHKEHRPVKVVQRRKPA